MSNSEGKNKATVTQLWVNVEINGEPAKVCIIGGMAKILFASCGFTIPIPGKYYDVSSVVRAHLEQQKLLKQALDNSSRGDKRLSWESPEGANIAADLGLSGDCEPPRECLPKCLVPISEDELESLTDGLRMVEDLSSDKDD